MPTPTNIPLSGTRPRRRFTWGCATLTLLVGIGLPLLFIHEVGRFEAGEDAPGVDWLPAKATRVCWFDSWNNIAFEFDLPEEDFLAWVAAEKDRFGASKLEPADGPPPPDTFRFSVLRYLAFLTPEKRAEAGLPLDPPEALRFVTRSPPTPEEWAEIEKLPEDQRRILQQQESVAPAKGWRYLERYTNGGGRYLAYDADRGRAYYYFARR